MTTNTLSGEQSNTKIVAVFETKNAAEQCSQTIQDQGVDLNQLDLVAPNEENYSRKLEPEEQGVKQTAIKSHLLFGIIGLVAGIALWAVLFVLKVTLITSSPISSLAAIVFFSTAGGLLFGGFITMRVDQQVVVQEVKTAKTENQWSLIMHPRTTKQTHVITQTLSDLGIDSVRSF